MDIRLKIDFKNCTSLFKFNYIRTFHHLLEGAGFFLIKFLLLQYLKIVHVYRSSMWLSEFMFCNTCILFFDLSFFSLGPEVESKQAPQPLALLCPPNLVRKDKEWTHVGLKWRCKIGTCIIAYCAKWLLTKHLKEVHGLVVEKAKSGRPSTAAGGPRHQDHAKMNARILGNVMVVQRRNDQKVVSRARAKAQREWKNLVAIAKQCPPFPKPALVKLASEQLLKVLGLNA